MGAFTVSWWKLPPSPVSSLMFLIIPTSSIDLLGNNWSCSWWSLAPLALLRWHGSLCALAVTSYSPGFLFRVVSNEILITEHKQWQLTYDQCQLILLRVGDYARTTVRLFGPLTRGHSCNTNGIEWSNDDNFSSVCYLVYNVPQILPTLWSACFAVP